MYVQKVSSLLSHAHVSSRRLCIAPYSKEGLKERQLEGLRVLCGKKWKRLVVGWRLKMAVSHNQPLLKPGEI